MARVVLALARFLNLDWWDHPMTPNASFPSGRASAGDAVLIRPDTDRQLDLLAEGIRLALAPAPTFFVVWQDGRDSIRLFAESIVKAGLKDSCWSRSSR